MKTLIRRLWTLILLVLIATGNAQLSAAQSPIPGGSDFSWLNGEWVSRTKVLTMDIKIVNSDQLAGTATFDYGGGVAHGTLQGKVIGDKIQITVSWPQRGTTSSYEFQREADGSLFGVITEGSDLNRKVRLRKS